MRITAKVSLLCGRVVSATALCAGLSLMLTGCGLGTPAGPAAPESQSISGKAMGGNGPIGDATVSLYVAGTGGYGQGGTTALATATTGTNANGNAGFFSINPTSYTCPTGGQVYLVLKDGDPTGGTTSNTAIGLVAPIGTCGSLNSFTVINEASTAATMFAAAQFFNATTETFGSNSSTQSQLGLANALALAQQLVPSTGILSTTFTPSSSVTGITMTATPDAGKLGTIADILASCVNANASAPGSQNNCTDLFNSAVGGPNAAVTSGSTQSSGSFSAATDTMQAAYYMAINPVDAGTTSGTSGTNAACYSAGTGGSTASASNISCLYGLVAGSGSPFDTTGLTATPSDWTVGIAYTASGTCPGAGSFIFAPFKSSVDANGNLWFVGGAANANLSEIGPTGQALTCLGDSSNGRGMTIDSNGNIWASFNGGGLTSDIQELPIGATSLIKWPITVNTNNSYFMSADGNGNVFYSTITSGGGLAEFIDPGTTTTPFQPIVLAANQIITTNGTNSDNTSGMGVDANNNIWLSFSTTAGIAGFYPGSATTSFALTRYSVASDVVTYTNSGTNTLAAGNTVTIADSSPLNGQSLTVLASPAPTSTSFAVSFNTADTGSPVTESGTATLALSYSFGLTASPRGGSYGLAGDAAGHIYTGLSCCGSTTLRQMVRYTPGATAPSGGTLSVTYSAQNAGGMNGARSEAIDGAGNIWVGNEFPGTGTSTSTGTYGVAEMTSAFTSISPGNNPGANCTTTVGCPSGGYLHAGLGYSQDIAVDPSGNVWVLNNGPVTATETGTNVEQIIGAAVPVVTPLSVAIQNSKLSTKP